MAQVLKNEQVKQVWKDADLKTTSKCSQDRTVKKKKKERKTSDLINGGKNQLKLPEFF